MEDIKEIRIRKVANLSSVAQKEVENKLAMLPNEFNYKGYAKVSYKEISPLSVVSVDPIEGNIINVFSDIMDKIKKKS